MDYVTVFDVGQSGYRQWWFPAIGLIFFGVSLVLFKYREDLSKGTAQYVMMVLPILAVLWALGALASTLGDYWTLSTALREGQSPVIEGVVEHFKPMPASGHGVESFSVAGKEFEYSDNIIIAGFNLTVSHGGPMREGLRVRIHYLRGEIARLEVARRD